MTIRCSFDWAEVSHVTGSCIRPGGKVLTERALEVCRLPSDSFVADIGCGAGGTLEYLKRSGIRHVAGLDYSEALLAEAMTRTVPGCIARARAEILPFRNGSLGAIFCECILSVTSDMTMVLNECSRVLKEEGFLIVSDLFHQEDRGDASERRSRELQTEGLLTKEEILGVLNKLGFSVLLWEEHKQFLKELVARMILAGKDLPGLWECNLKRKGEETYRRAISYFLLVGRKKEISFPEMDTKGDYR